MSSAVPPFSSNSSAPEDLNDNDTLLVEQSGGTPIIEGVPNENNIIQINSHKIGSSDYHSSNIPGSTSALRSLLQDTNTIINNNSAPSDSTMRIPLLHPSLDPHDVESVHGHPSFDPTAAMAKVAEHPYLSTRHKPVPSYSAIDPKLYDASNQSFHHQNSIFYRSKPLHQWFTQDGVFLPSSTFSLVWDWLLLILALYNTFMLPLPACFFPSLCADPAVATIDYLVDLFFLMDIYGHLITAHTNEWGILIKDKKEIKMKYIQGDKIIFLCDVIGILPLEFFGLMAGIPWGDRTLAILRMTRLLRLHRIKTSERVLDSFNSIWFRLFRLLLSLFIMLHWMGCIFYLIGVEQGSSENSIFGPSWVIAYNLDQANGLTQYIVSLYWATITVSTLGYGDIVPKTDPEKVFTIGVILIGVVFNNVLLGNIVLLIQNMDAAASRYREKIEMIDEFIKMYKIPPTLGNNLRETHKSLWLIHAGIDMNTLIDMLPPSQRTAVRLYLHRNLLQSVPWFQRVNDEDFIKTLVTRLKTEVFLKGEWIFQQGSTGSHMYFISRGRVKIYGMDPISKDIKFESVQGEGSYFGEIALLMNTRRTASVITLSHCEIGVLSKEDFLDVLSIYPQHAKEILVTAHRRRMKQARQAKQREKERELKRKTQSKIKGNSTFTFGVAQETDAEKEKDKHSTHPKIDNLGTDSTAAVNRVATEGSHRRASLTDRAMVLFTSLKNAGKRASQTQRNSPINVDKNNENVQETNAKGIHSEPRGQVGRRSSTTITNKDNSNDTANTDNNINPSIEIEEVKKSSSADPLSFATYSHPHRGSIPSSDKPTSLLVPSASRIRSSSSPVAPKTAATIFSMISSLKKRAASKRTATVSPSTENDLIPAIGSSADDVIPALIHNMDSTALMLLEDEEAHRRQQSLEGLNVDAIVDALDGEEDDEEEDGGLDETESNTNQRISPPTDNKEQNLVDGNSNEDANHTTNNNSAVSVPGPSRNPADVASEQKNPLFPQISIADEDENAEEDEDIVLILPNKLPPPSVALNSNPKERAGVVASIEEFNRSLTEKYKIKTGANKKKSTTGRQSIKPLSSPTNKIALTQSFKKPLGKNPLGGSTAPRAPATAKASTGAAVTFNFNTKEGKDKGSASNVNSPRGKPSATNTGSNSNNGTDSGTIENSTPFTIGSSIAIPLALSPSLPLPLSLSPPLDPTRNVSSSSAPALDIQAALLQSVSALMSRIDQLERTISTQQTLSGEHPAPGS